MEETYKQILKDIADRLDSVTRANWFTGDFNQWTNYAKAMKETIKSVTPILNTIASSINDEPKYADKGDYCAVCGCNEFWNSDGEEGQQENYEEED